jgi:hypothetical protein
MNGRTRGQALASARVEQLRLARLGARRHAGTLAHAHELGQCHDGTLCPMCERDRALVKSTKIEGSQ